MKPKLLIIEGSIGSGKSTIARLLRENMGHTTLLSLSSIKNDSEITNFLYHSYIFNLIYDSLLTESNFILERSFISNEVYARMGHKDYNNTESYESLIKRLQFLSRYMDIKIFILATTKQEFEKRLGKRNKFELIDHTTNEAIKQQRTYLEIGDELRNAGLEVHTINNTGLTKTQTLNLILNFYDE